MTTRHPSPDSRQVRRANLERGVMCVGMIAGVLWIAGCSDSGSSVSNADDAIAGTSPASNSAPPPPMGGADAVPSPAAQDGMAGVSTAGAGGPSAGQPAGAGAPAGQPAGAGAGVPNAGQPAGAGAGGPSAGQPAGPAASGDGAGGTMQPGGVGEMEPVDEGSAGTEPAGGIDAMGVCTREFLATNIDAYFAALAAHDANMLPLADSVKFTENGEMLDLGEGLWATAGMVSFKESLLDTDKCGTVTQAVVPDGGTDIPLAVRLQFEAQQITEIQTIAVRDGDYLVASNTGNMNALTPWGEIVPEAERQTREELESWIDKYFRMFPMGVCNITPECKRMENGFTLQCSAGASCTDREPSGAGVMEAQIILSDVEAGLAAGFTMFLGSYSDVHMVKYSGGDVHGVHTILGEADSSGWD